MTEIEFIIARLFETNETVTLDALFRQTMPDLWVQDIFGFDDLDVPLKIREVDPSKLTFHGNSVRKILPAARKPPHWGMIKDYMQDPGPPIVIRGNEVLDGHHRAVAAFLAKRLIQSVNIDELPTLEAAARGGNICEARRKVERIVDAAVRFGSKIFTGSYHPDAIWAAWRGGAFPQYDDTDNFEAAWENGLLPEGESGFVTNTGRFIDRKEAFKIAALAGQIDAEQLKREGGLSFLPGDEPELDAGDAFFEADEEEDFEKEGWKEVSDLAASSEVERWCFTNYDLVHPERCRRTDEFILDAGTELGVIMLRDGEVTNRWEDGTVGVPADVREAAEADESPVKIRGGLVGRKNGHDVFADNWLDVFVNPVNGLFMGFVRPPLLPNYMLGEAYADAGEADLDSWRDVEPEYWRQSYQEGGWFEEKPLPAFPSPDSVIFRVYRHPTSPRFDRWQMITYSKKDRAWKLDDTTGSILSGSLDDVFKKADELWAKGR